MPRAIPLAKTAVAVALPGTGSGTEFVRSAFAAMADQAGIPLICVEPDPRGVISSYDRALSAAARHGPVLIAGVSIGAAAALAWAAAHPGQVTAVLAALPPWTGLPATAPAAMSARHTAADLRAEGLAAVTARMRAASPAWLGDTLSRSWAAQWPHLPDALLEAAGYVIDPRNLAKVAVPVGIAAALDDPVHPLAVARHWQTLLPQAGLRTRTLDSIGGDPARLGQDAFAALADAGLGR
jgi:pimeloyl-ACP methyl ester carboxylesterase